MNRLLASLIAATATSAPLALISGYVLLTDTGLDLQGQIDNAPVRAAAAILFLIVPAGFVTSAIYFPLLGWVLARNRSHSLGTFAAVAGVLSLGATVVFVTRDGEGGASGWPSGSIMLGAVLLASLLLGSTVWCRLVRSWPAV